MLRWLVRLSIGALLGALVIWAWNRYNQDLADEELLDAEIPFEFDVAEDGAGDGASEPGRGPAAQGDDLTRIKGIGPVYNTRLAEMGITTYGALLAAPDDQLLTAFPRMSAAELAVWREQARALNDAAS